MIVDDDTNSIVDYKWKLIPIDDSLAEPDSKLQEYIDSFKDAVDKKYNTILCKLAKKLTHPLREIETTLGNLVADAFASAAQSDLVLVGSGSIRVEEIGPLVTLKDFKACFPYDDFLNRYTASGNKLKKIFSYIMRNENRDGEGECYQVNEGIEAVHDEKAGTLQSLKVKGEPIDDNKLYTVCIQGYHFNNSADYLGITNEELLEAGNHKVITTSAQEVLEEYLKNNQNISRDLEGRLVYK